MATYEITGPDGSTYEVDAPDDASEAQVLSYVKDQWGKQRAAQRKADADTYAGQDVKQMGAVMRGLGGAKHAWDRGALGLKGLVTDLSDEDKTLLRQGDAFTKEGGFAGTVGELGGDIAMTAAPALRAMRGIQAGARVLPRALGRVVANPVAAAGGAGAAVGAATNPMDRKAGAIGGGLGGAGGEIVGRVLTRALGGLAARGVTPEARELMAQGIDVPMWKGTSSAGLRNMAERAKALPLVGEVMKGQERRAIEQWNRRLVEQASPPVPVLDEAAGVLRWEARPVRGAGQDAMRQLNERFGDAYDALYRGRTIPVDDVFAGELDTIARQTEAYLPGVSDDVLGAIRRANDTLRRGTEATTAVSPILDAAGKPITSQQLGHAGVSNQNIKTALQELDTSITSAWRQGNQEKAEALELVRDAIDGLRQRGLPPEVASMRESINAAYSNYKLLQRASSGVGAMRQEGVISPRQMISAVKASDRSPNKSMVTQGRARGQQEAQRAEQVLGSELPEVGPGTAEKLMLAAGLGVGWMAPAAGAGLLLGTRQGQRFLQGGYGWQNALRNNPEALANLLRSVGIAANND